METSWTLPVQKHKFSDLYLCFCGYEACQPFHSIHKAVPPDFHEVIHGIDLSSTAVPVPVIFTRHINQAVMLIMTIIGAFLFQHAAFVGKQII